jgi:cytochrome c-type biogenesis protein CcmH
VTSLQARLRAFLRRFPLLPLLLLAPLALAIDTGPAFEDPELQARYERIVSEVRCLQCQNESIRDSNAFLAADLRREIRRLLSEGRSDAAIYDFLVERYGEFVLYRPRTSGKTLFLWLAPGVLIVAGAAVAAAVIRRRMRMPIEGEGDEAKSSVSGRP